MAGASSGDVRAPLVTIVTPSFNQAPYIRATIESVLDQDHPAIEYLVMDGGSTDGTVGVVREYEDRLSWWSEGDRGTAHAINKGWRRARGQILHWLNSDDVLLPGTVSTAVREFERHPEAVAVYGPGIVLDAAGDVIGDWPVPPVNIRDALLVCPVLLQPSIFIRADAFSRVGPLDERLHWSFELDFYVRMLHDGPWVHVDQPLSGARRQDESLTNTGGVPRLWEIYRVLHRHGVPVTARAYRIQLVVACLLALDRASRQAPGWVRPTARRLHDALAATQVVLMLHGGHHPDGWAGPRLVWRPGTSGSVLHISGVLDTDTYPTLRDQTMTVLVDGQRAARAPVPDGSFDLEIPFSVPMSPSSVMEIRASKTFVPRRMGINEDRRRLAYLVRSLRVS